MEILSGERKAEALRDRLMRGVGTDEPWVTEEMSAEFGEYAISVHYRRPLRIDEVVARRDEAAADESEHEHHRDEPAEHSSLAAARRHRSQIPVTHRSEDGSKHDDGGDREQREAGRHLERGGARRGEQDLGNAELPFEQRGTLLGERTIAIVVGDVPTDLEHLRVEIIDDRAVTEAKIKGEAVALCVRSMRMHHVFRGGELENGKMPERRKLPGRGV